VTASVEADTREKHDHQNMIARLQVKEPKKSKNLNWHTPVFFADEVSEPRRKRIKKTSGAAIPVSKNYGGEGILEEGRKKNKRGKEEEMDEIRGLLPVNWPTSCPASS